MSRTSWIILALVVIAVAYFLFMRSGGKLPQWQSMVNRNMGYPGA